MRPFTRRSKLPQDAYNKVVAKGLDAVYDATASEQIQISKLRTVIISDLHRGARDQADDFERGESHYAAALGSYLERGYQLWLLGDVEELWENGVDEVMASYFALLELERAFAEGPGLRRFWGNHDLAWKKQERVESKLRKYLTGDVEVHEGMRLVVLDGEERLGEVFLAHGHQGTMSSEWFQFWGRLALRVVWRRFQNAQTALSTTPASSFDLRAKHDKAMAAWARSRGIRNPGECPVLVAGHTHHPVFPGVAPKLPTSAEAADLEYKLNKGRQDGTSRKRLARTRAELESIQALLRQEPHDPSRIDPPCYFNTGCCCFPDGDVTCVELADGEIRLMRWPNDRGRSKPKELAKLPLRDVLAQMAAASN